jgi:hypothetical protein
VLVLIIYLLHPDKSGCYADSDKSLELELYRLSMPMLVLNIYLLHPDKSGCYADGDKSGCRPQAQPIDFDLPNPIDVLVGECDIRLDTHKLEDSFVGGTQFYLLSYRRDSSAPPNTPIYRGACYRGACYRGACYPGACIIQVPHEYSGPNPTEAVRSARSQG